MIKMAKYIFITGGVVSGLGKGIAAASIGLILKSRGYKVVNQKFDPYLNIDPGTMNPYQHGEVFVTDDGAETDLDLGHYERFTDASLSQSSNTTAGRVYLAVLNKEREGGFHGGTVQVIPNITEEILRRMMLSTAETNADVIITEIGGTVGDIESLPFMEAIRQMKYKVGEENCCYIHLTLVPYMKKSQELKTKPTQHSVKELQELGIQPDIIMLRTEEPIDTGTRERLASFCNVDTNHVIQNLTARSIYEVPLQMEHEGLGNAVCEALALKNTPPDLADWQKMVDKFNNPKRKVTIALVGKYVELHDAYLSVAESLVHGGIHNEADVTIDWIGAEKLPDDKTALAHLKAADGIIIPGGFGGRGIEGMVYAAKYARTHKVPYFGICLGMQIQVIEYARNVLGLKDANSSEMDKTTSDPVIDLMPDQNGKILGGTLRLGKYECKIKPGTLAEKAYGAKTIWERHRHRYEFNNAYRDRLIQAGLIISGVNPERDLVEICEAPDHPWMVGVQFHPEFKSRPNRAGPLFREFIKAACEYSVKNKTQK
ncbi:CTP synthase [Treponema socranskii subsp. socranskii VPI DR56BR1116 = ATCC 35536]|uniref:CTP synthase n=4 Tax=Treponema socranskii TaxID=53419 RepID=A0ABN0P5G3_TRESO|nr:CTP synthase [Treponema socranskii subsp. socranskii VPI DR56BR1116 = ATCC 35536]